MLYLAFSDADAIHLREMGRQQLLTDYESVVDCLHGTECPRVANEAGERFIFTSRLLRRLQVLP